MYDWNTIHNFLSERTWGRDDFVSQVWVSQRESLLRRLSTELLRSCRYEDDWMCSSDHRFTFPHDTPTLNNSLCEKSMEIIDEPNGEKRHGDIFELNCSYICVKAILMSPPPPPPFLEILKWSWAVEVLQRWNSFTFCFFLAVNGNV